MKLLATFAFFVLVAASPSYVAAIALITEEEVARAKGASQPVPQSFQARPGSGGPRIEILSPNFAVTEKPTVPKPFPLKVRFAAQDGAQVAMNSLRVTYVAFFDIDITDRLRPYINGDQIAVEEADIPVGEHSIRIDITDSRGRTTQQMLQFAVR
jgi:hypothetical protein